MIAYYVLRIAYCGAGSTAGFPLPGNMQYAIRNTKKQVPRPC